MKINSEEEIEDWPGVYAIINKTNGREYVGSSEKGILSRINQHERLLKTGKHNRKEVQEDYNNGDVFEAEIIFILPIGGTRKQLLSREIEEIKKRGAKTRLYNAHNWAMHKNRQTGKLEKIEYLGSYYLPRQYWGGGWDGDRDCEVVRRENTNNADSGSWKNSLLMRFTPFGLLATAPACCPARLLWLHSSTVECRLSSIQPCFLRFAQIGTVEVCANCTVECFGSVWYFN